MIVERNPLLPKLRGRNRLGLRFSALSVCAFLSGTALAQEGEDAETPAEPRKSGVEMMYGGVTIAGAEEEGPEEEESNFGLSRMYGGVSGSAGVHGTKVARKRKDVPEFHVVKKGDTLWDLSDEYYGSPWAWPQVWSLNPQIENPHWIYPGDQVRTAQGQGSQKSSTSLGGSDDNSAGEGGFIGRSRVVPEGTVFTIDHGYIGDPEEDVWGEVAGAHRDLMLLTEGDILYLVMNEGVELRLGQRLNIFKEIADPPEVEDSRTPPGKIVKIYGTVRIDGWDRDKRVAKGSLIESVDIVERGFKVGPVGRRFDVVAPKQATEDVEARLLGGLYPHTYFGSEQVIFIDKGSEDGLVTGNRLRALRRGDTWRRKLKTANYHARMRLELGDPDVPSPERTPLRGDDEDFPDEVIGEVVVLRTEDYSSICLVTSTTRGLESGERLVAVKGY